MWEGMRRLLKDRSGNVIMMLAGATSLLFAIAALAVDTGMIFLEKRRLQGIADSAALAAARNLERPRAEAEATLAANRGSAHLRQVIVGIYRFDPAMKARDRFRPGDLPANAALVTIDREFPTLFGRLLKRNEAPVSASATAARVDLAAFSIGTRLAAISGGVPNSILSALAGTDLDLSLMDYNALVSAKVDVLAFSEALRSELELEGVTFGEVLATEARLPQMASALAAATDDGAAAALEKIAKRLPDREIVAADIIDLGPLSGLVRADPRKPVDVSAASILRAVLETSNGSRQVEAAAALDVPHLASAKIRFAAGQRPANSPWLAVSAADKLVVRTAQSRLSIDVELSNAAPSGVGRIHVPIVLELASAEARLHAVSCGSEIANSSASLEVTPSVGTVAIADADALGDFEKPMSLRPAALIDSPLASVTGYSEIALGGTMSQFVEFSAYDIANHRAKTVSTGDLTRGVAKSLLEQTSLEARIAILGLNAGVLSSAIGQELTLASSSLDLLINEVAGVVGLRVGQADTRVDGIRCGMPVLVG